jgi:hypothetical protein
MSDDWIVSIKMMTMGFALLSAINNFEVKTEVLMEGPHIAEYSQEWRGDEMRIQDLRAAAAELAGQEQEQVHAPEYLYEAEQPQTVDQVREQADSWEHKLDDLDQDMGDLADAVKMLTETEEERRREDPPAISELLQARQEALEELLETQRRDDAEKQAENAEFRKDLAERHAGSPAQEMYLKKFDDVVEADKKDRDDKYAAQVRELDGQWQQKFKEFDKQPLTIPTVQDHDRDDEDKQR